MLPANAKSRPGVTADLGLKSGIQFQRRDAGAIGIQSVIDMDLLDVVDIWGNIPGTYEVCFPQSLGGSEKVCRAHKQ